MPFLSTVSRAGAASRHQIRGCLGQTILTHLLRRSSADTCSLPGTDRAGDSEP